MSRTLNEKSRNTLNVINHHLPAGLRGEITLFVVFHSEKYILKSRLRMPQ